MKEWGIDISGQTSESVNDYLDKGIEVVITVCDNANKICPVFLDKTIRIHWSIEDPFSGWDADKLRLDAFRKTRDLIKSKLTKFLSITEVH